MCDFDPVRGVGGASARWQRIDRFCPQEAATFVETLRITRRAQRAYMGAHVVSEAIADEQIRLLVTRFLQVGRLARESGGTVVRARSPKADGDDAYSFLLDLRSGHVIGYRGPAASWFDDVHTPLEDLLQARAEQRRREEAKQERRAAHEQRMREQQEAAARRAAFRPTWPVLPDGQYDQSGGPAPVPVPRRPITDEARIRYVGRLPHVVFHADALNSPFFRNVPLERRCEALHRVLDFLLRRPSKSTVVIGSQTITVTGKKVTLTLSRDCAMVRTLNPPRPGNKNEPASYLAKHWAKERR
ncbi:hypothetical protein ACH4VR_40335 [Streptomyces sp. NPDC020883]|uniref:hypothetical protein n=1 Tax=Streptomyces sp. NPDC020883 TaxID=3365099 RepID=UPI0037B827BB